MFSKKYFIYSYNTGLKSIRLNRNGDPMLTQNEAKVEDDNQEIIEEYENLENSNSDSEQIQQDLNSILGIDSLMQESESYFKEKNKSKELINQLTEKFESKDNLIWDGVNQTLTTKFEKNMQSCDRFFAKRIERSIEHFKSQFKNYDY